MVHSVPTQGQKQAKCQIFPCCRLYFQNKTQMRRKPFLSVQFTPTAQSISIHSQTFPFQPLPSTFFAETVYVLRSFSTHWLQTQLLRAHEHSCWHREAQHPTPPPPGHKHSPGSTSATPKPCLTATPVPSDSAGPQLYLKHVVSSPEDFRQGYLVVAILFSEHTSLCGGESWEGNSVEGQRESGEQYALGSATRRTGCYWSPGGLSSRNEPREIPQTGRPQS